MKNPFKLVALAISVLFSAPGLGADADAGKALHDAHCTACHGSEVYTRANRKVTSRDGLLAQVGRCDAAVGTKWFQDDIEDVVEYLNGAYYHF